MTNKKVLISKWMKHLYTVHLVLLASSVLSSIPLLGIVFKWVSSIFSLLSVYILYQLVPVNERYRKAAIFSGISIIVGMLTRSVNVTLIALVISICSLVGTYQEYCGHSELLDGIDNSLARKWHSLFTWQIFGGLVLGVLISPVIVLLTVLIALDANVLTGVILVAVTGVNIILELVYLSYLKRTREQYEAFPWNMDGGQTVDYI